MIYFMSDKLFLILGLTLQFTAFWLAAPEILGVEWLKKAEKIIRKIISNIPNFLLMILGMFMGIFFSTTIKNFTLLGIAAAILMALTLLFSKKISRTLDVKISKPLLDRLIVSSNLRYALLKIAATLFTLGFLIQIVMILIS